MKFHNLIREYFTFSRNERIGISFLIGLIILLAIANRAIFYFEIQGKVDQQMYRSFLASVKSDSQVTEQSPKIDGTLFYFDPNTIDSLAMDSLFLPARVKKNLLSYRMKGGRFYIASDLKKIYGMNDSIFECVEPYIAIVNPVANISKKEEGDSSVLPSPRKSVESNPRVYSKIDLNTATEADLMELKGIGKTFSARIIKYRNLLGGYFQLNQLSEVYGLPQNTIDQVSSWLTVDTLSIQKMNVNFAEKKELARHPYLGWPNAQNIVDFRSKNGAIDQISLLRVEKVLPDSVFVRIRPYFKTKN